MNNHFLKTLLFSKNPDYSFAVITPHIDEIDLKTFPYLNQCTLVCYKQKLLIRTITSFVFNFKDIYLNNPEIELYVLVHSTWLTSTPTSKVTVIPKKMSQQFSDLLNNEPGCSLYFGSRLIAGLNTMTFNLLKFHIENTK